VNNPKPPASKSVVSPNLLPQDEKEEQYYDSIAQTLKRLAQFALILLLVLWVIGGLLILRINQEKKSFTQKLDTAANQGKLKELAEINSQLKDLRALNGKVDRSIKSEYLFSDLLGELTKIAPPGVAIIAFETIIDQPGWIRVKGVARTRADFLKFKEGLEGSKYYSQVESPLSNYVTPESLSFELNVLVKDWKPIWAEEIKKKAKKRTTTEEALGD
jgi:hypothetical protein